MNDIDIPMEELKLPPLVAKSPPRVMERDHSARSSQTLSPNLLRGVESSDALPAIENANNWKGKLQQLRKIKGSDEQDEDANIRNATSNTPLGMAHKPPKYKMRRKPQNHAVLPPIHNRHAFTLPKLYEKKKPPIAAPKPLTYKHYLDPDISSEERFNDYFSEIQKCNDDYISDYVRDLSQASRVRAAAAERAGAAAPGRDVEGSDLILPYAGFMDNPANCQPVAEQSVNSEHADDDSFITLSAPLFSELDSVNTQKFGNAPRPYVNKLSKLTAITRQDIEAKLARRDYAIIGDNYFKPVKEIAQSKNYSRVSTYLQDELLVEEAEVERMMRNRKHKVKSMKDTVKAPKYGLIQPRNVVYNSFHGILGQDGTSGGWTFTETFKSRKNLEIFEP